VQCANSQISTTTAKILNKTRTLL